MKETKTVLSYPVYMVDFAVYKPDDELRINLNECADSCWKWKHPGTKAAAICSCYFSSRGSSGRIKPAAALQCSFLFTLAKAGARVCRERLLRVGVH